MCGQNLNLSCCSLNEVPDVFCVMRELTALDLSMNDRLSSLVEGIYLRNLELINLSRCNFDEVRTPFSRRVS